MDVVILLENNLPLGTSMPRGVVATNILFRIRKQLFYQAIYFCSGRRLRSLLAFINIGKLLGVANSLLHVRF